MVKPVLVAVALYGAAVLLCGVWIIVGVDLGGHRGEPMLVSLSLEVATFVAAAVGVFRVARAAAPTGGMRWVLLTLFLIAAGFTMVPFTIATALAFDH